MLPDIGQVFDFHVHAGPDVRPRKMTSIELALAARQAGLRGFVLKNHHFPTVALAQTVAEAVPGIVVEGGVALNESVGGYNAEAVEAALGMGGRLVWMPTLCAEHERIYRGRPGTGMRLHGADGAIPAALRDVLKLIAEHGAVLATGHFSYEEIVDLIAEGRRLGVQKFVVNHPGIVFQNFSNEQQRDLAGPGVYFERSYARADYTQPWPALAESIRAVGVESSLLGTDLGQADQPDPVTGMLGMLEALSREGFGRAELETMACKNPARLLELDP